MDIKSIEKTANLVHNNQMSLMIFQMIHELKEAPTFYGVNVFKVREVIEAKKFPVADTPNSHELIEGMIQLRGSFLPVIDLPRWLGTSMTKEEKNNSVIIVCDFSNNIVGIRVAHIHGVEEKSWNELLPAQNLGTQGKNRVVNQTEVKFKDKDNQEKSGLCYILDVEKLLSECMPEMAEKLKPVIEKNELLKLEDKEWHDFFDNKILACADDSPTIRLYLESVLKQLSIPFKIFENGKQLIDFLEVTEKDKVSAIITDLEMPEASGHTVIKYARNSEKFRNIKIAVHTSMTSENNERDVQKLGANFFIGKINTEEVKKALKRMVGDKK